MFEYFHFQTGFFQQQNDYFFIYFKEPLYFKLYIFDITSVKFSIHYKKNLSIFNQIDFLKKNQLNLIRTKHIFSKNYIRL